MNFGGGGGFLWFSWFLLFFLLLPTIGEECDTLLLLGIGDAGSGRRTLPIACSVGIDLRGGHTNLVRTYRPFLIRNFSSLF